ncbi:MAG: EAL domain-containing protein [Actinomycetota bacterium]
MKATGGTRSVALRAVAGWAVLYLVVGVLAALIQPDKGQSAWYPPIAIGVAMLLTLGWSVWPVVLGCDLVVSLVQYDLHPAGIPISGVTTALEAALIVVILRRMRFSLTFERVEDVVIMGGAAAAATLAGATVGSWLLGITGATKMPFQQAWGVWAIGDLTGLVLVLPFLLLVVAYPKATRGVAGASRRRIVEHVIVMGMALSLVAGYFLAMNPHSFSVQKSGVLMLVLLPTLWVAVRFGLVTTSIYTVAMTTTACIAYVGVGPHLVHPTTDPPSGVDMVSMMLPLLSVGLASVGVAAAISAQQRARNRENAIVDASPIGIATIDHDGVVRTWSAAAERVMGMSAHDVIGTSPAVLRAVMPARATVDAATPTIAEQHTIRHVRDDGQRVVTKVFTSPLFDHDARFAGVVAAFEDITEQENLHWREALLGSAIEQAGEAIVVTDASSMILYANPAACTSSGYPLEHLVGENPRIFSSGLHDPAHYQRMWSTLRDGRAWSGKLINRRSSGELYEEEANIAPVLDVDGSLMAYVGVKHDLSRERALEADVLQGRQDRATIQAIIEQVRSEGSVNAIASALCTKVVELTDFDAVALLLLQSDDSLIPAGLAGTPFDGASDVVVAPGAGATALVALTARSSWCRDWTRHDERADPWTERFRTRGITATAYASVRWEDDLFGVLLVASVAPDGPALLQRQLGLLGELASFAGVMVGSKVEADRSRDEIRSEIRDIIEQRRFRPAFQPYVDLQTGEVRGYEALTRFTDGTAPDRKIREAWLVGMGPSLEAAVARFALEVADQRLPEVQISLNFSPDTILTGLAAAVVRNVARPVVIEVTEHTAVEDYPALRRALAACGDVKVSIDDAGAGFAGLRHILELKPDVVKLDIGLIHGIDTDLARQALAAGLSHYAATAGTLLIAEGIETAAEAAAVRRLGIHYAQGYYFGRPEILS